MKTTPKFYAFKFADGAATTTGGDHGRRLRIAGCLVSFPSARDRVAWVSDGYDTRVPRDVGEFRRAVTTRALPFGWRTTDAVEIDELEIDWSAA